MGSLLRETTLDDPSSSCIPQFERRTQWMFAETDLDLTEFNRVGFGESKESCIEEPRMNLLKC